MADEVEPVQMDTQSNAGKWLLTLLAVLVVAASGYAHYATHQAVKKLNQDLGAGQAQVQDLEARLQHAEAQEVAIASQVGMTKKELAARTAEVQAEERASTNRLEKEQKAQEAQIGQVSGQISGVQTDVGGVRTDLTSTKADLDATKAKLQSTIGDLGVQSGLIANTRSDLEVLKHKGDRNYYEFTLLRNAKPQPVATVSLQLKKTDSKRGKFTLNVTSDDKTIEKKDRNVSEPIQFYSGRDHLLFELVVWTVDKNKATGYLSTPKAAPVPVTAN
jgi:chromosome segregation ATPase